MNSDKIIDAFGTIDDEMIEEVEILKKKEKRESNKWGILVACFALLIAVSWTASKSISVTHTNNTEPSIGLNATQGVNNLDINAEKLIYVNYRLYAPNPELTQMFSQSNVGEFAGYVSFDGKNETTISAYALVGNIGEGNNIVVDYNGNWYVYSFLAFTSDGTNEWPVSLLRNTDYIEVRDPNYGIDNKKVYQVLSAQQEITAMLEFLSSLGDKHNQKETNQRYYELFKNFFDDEDLWIDEEGNIGKANVEISMAFNELVCGADRRIVVVMEDGAELSYSYLPGAGVVLCEDFAYFLSDDKVRQINQMIGLQ